ncbi:MAG: [FeFe] hydrogenase H-cluster radical SAM maturase HydG [Defluviitaleaceae bacterium]|nr:[FeFe] hydrogenase H-cluster radical SAM maturase HydG [Defluviitaleaceae bacterium]
MLNEIMAKATKMKGLEPHEALFLLETASNEALFDLAGSIKSAIYGSRVVLFAPLYLSNYCVNGCVYCPYRADNEDMPRKRLTQDQIRKEVQALTAMGHKRIVIETGEHPQESPIDYILESIDTIYKSGDIRRINVNIAATTEEDYRRLAAANIGTYILFQETYHRPTYEKLHPYGPKSDFDWHSGAMDRAIETGLHDVGIGALFGLADYRHEVAGLLNHAKHLETTYGVGPHTISVPRLPNGMVDDETFARIVAILRIAVPYTGIILSTREDELIRRKLLDIGVSQISGGSCTSVGGYAHSDDSRQFEISDTRNLHEIVTWLMDAGYTPSFCTACYREGRVGEKFMKLCKSGDIHDICQRNALKTLQEYLSGCSPAYGEGTPISHGLMEAKK